MFEARLPTVAVDVPAATSEEQPPPVGAVRFQRHVSSQLPMVRVRPSAVSAPAVRLRTCDRDAAGPDSSEAAPAPEAFLARTMNRYVVLLVSPVTVCDRLDEVLSMSVQSGSQAFKPAFFRYCHFVSVAVPVTEEVTFALPLPRFTSTAGVAGFGGRVA